MGGGHSGSWGSALVVVRDVFGARVVVQGGPISTSSPAFGSPTTRDRTSIAHLPEDDVAPQLWTTLAGRPRLHRENQRGVLH